MGEPLSAMSARQPVQAVNDLHSCDNLFNFDARWCLPRVSWAEALADVFFDIDDDEIARRNESGLRTVANHVLLRTLGALPLGVRVPLRMINPEGQLALMTAPPGIVRCDDEMVERLWTPAVMVQGLVVHCRSWTTGMHPASTLVRFGKTGLVTQRRPRQIAQARQEAGRRGVGLAVNNRSDGLAVEIAPARRERFDTVTLWFRELLLDAVLGRDASQIQPSFKLG